MLADVRFEDFEDGVVAKLSGEVDMSNADEIGKAIKQALTNQAMGLVLDLRDVDYFDSAGIHLIYDLREALRVRGQQIGLVVPEESPAYDALELAAVVRVLEISPTVEDAKSVVVRRA